MYQPESSLGKITSVCLVLTEAEEVKDPVHGVFPVSGVVFQPQDQNLLPADHAQPVHQVHDVQADLQPDLKGAGEKEILKKTAVKKRLVCHLLMTGSSLQS